MINLRSDKKPGGNFLDGLRPSRVQFRVRSNSEQTKTHNQQTLDYNQTMSKSKDLLVRKAQLMQRDNQQKLDSIVRARNQDLKNQARILKDESVINLLQNADKLNNTKNLLQRIANQDINSFEHLQKNKGKKHWEKFKDSDLEIQNKNKRYLTLIEDLEKTNQKDRAVFQDIQRYEGEIINVLTRKEKDYLKKADQLNDEIEKRKSVLRDTKSVKDRKKAELVQLLISLLDNIKYHQEITTSRNREVEQLYNGNQGVEGFDQFATNFEMVVQYKIEENRMPENTFKKLSQTVSNYHAVLDQVAKMRQDEGHVFEEMQDVYKRNVKVALLERAYLSGLSTQKSDLIELVKKCRQYRKLLQSLQQDRLRISRQLTKVNKLNSLFYNQYKAISNQASRKQQLRIELQAILAQQSQLEKTQKKKRNYQYQLSNLELRKKAIERQMEDCASKGNLNEYKVKMKEFEKVGKDIDLQKEYGNNQNIAYMEDRLLSEVQILTEKYADLIRDVIIDQNDMDYMRFLSKLSKRLTLI